MQEITDALLNNIIQEQDKKTMIAHYTTIEGLHGMISGITSIEKVPMIRLWASNIMALNDPSELFYGYSILCKWLPEIEDELKIQENERLSRIWKEHAALDEHLRELVKHQDLKPYVISFTHKIDNLAMYRMYGNDAAGVCIVLSYELLKDKLKLYDICYEEKIKADVFSPYKMLRSVYKLYLDEFRKKEFKGNDIFELKLKHLVTYLLMIAPYVKRGDYEYEKEIRHSCLYKLSDGIKFRTSKRGNIIPYKEIEIPVSAIEKIIIGPCANYEPLKYSIELEFTSKGISKIPIIEKSNKEYRRF